MSRLKTFLIYALVVIGFYFFSNLLMLYSQKGFYQNIRGEILTKTPSIEIKEAKATYINGYIDGILKNDTLTNIENQYIKIDIFSERNVNLGTKYIKVEHLEANKTQEFHMGYRYTDSYRYEVSLVQEIEGMTEEQFISEDLTSYALLAGVLALCFI